MEISFQQYEDIQRYFDDGMDDKEKADFLIEVGKNAALNENFELEQQLRDGPVLGEVYIMSLFEKAGKKWKEDERKRLLENNRRKRQSYVLLAVAASIMAIVGIFIFNNRTIEKKTIIATAAGEKSLKAPDTTTTVDSKPTESSDNKARWEAAFDKYYQKAQSPQSVPERYAALFNDGYNIGDYKNLQNFDPYRNQPRSVSKDTMIEIIRYYKGVSFIETGDYSKAARELQWVINNAKNKTLLQKALWYKSLIFLKDNDPLKAAALLKKLLVDEKAAYHRQAKKMLIELRQ